MERLLLHRLARERLDDAHAGDVLGERRRDEAEPLADAAVGAVRAAAEPGGHERHRDQHRQRRQRELPVEEEEDDGRADQEQRVLDQARDAVGDELVERLDVVRDPADHDAGAVALVEAEREPLQVARRACCAGRRGRARRPSRSGTCSRRRGRARAPRRRGRAAMIQVSRLRSPRLDPLVDRELRQVRRRERDERVGEQRRRARAPCGRGRAAPAGRAGRAAGASAATTSRAPRRRAPRRDATPACQTFTRSPSAGPAAARARGSPGRRRSWSAAPPACRARRSGPARARRPRRRARSSRAGGR